MAKAKNAGRRSGKARNEAAKAENTGLSPVAQHNLNVRLAGGVSTVEAPMSPADRAQREKGAEMVKIPRLDFTVFDRGKKVYPSDEPVEISFACAVTHGLVNADGQPNPSYIQAESLVTTVEKTDVTRANDNGHGGDGSPSGAELPATDLASQGPTRQEIAEAAEAAGTSTEQMAEKRQAEIDARRAALTP